MVPPKLQCSFWVWLTACLLPSITIASSLRCSGGHEWGFALTWRAARVFATPIGIKPREFGFARWDDERNVEKFIEAKSDLLIHRAFPDEREAGLLAAAFPDPAKPLEIAYPAIAKLVVVVHASNPIQGITTPQIRDLLRWEGKLRSWKDFGLTRSDAIECFGEAEGTVASLTLRHRVMMLGPDRPTGYYLYRKDMKLYKDRDELLRELRKHPDGMAFILYNGEALPRWLKILPVASSPAGPFVQPPRSAMIQWDYPLIEPLVYYLRPDADKLLRDYVNYALSEQAAPIWEGQGLITPRQDAQAQAQQRLADLRAGKGEPLTVCGQGNLYYLARDLTLAFTRSKRAVELKYEPETADRLATLFLQGHHNILLSWGTPIGVPAGNPKFETRNPNEEGKSEVGGRKSEVGNRELEIGNWKSEIAAPKPGSLAAQWQDMEKRGLKSYTIGARVAAVVVNSKTGKTSLTPNELRMILAGQVRDWRALGVPDGQLEDNAIQLFMPGVKSPISRLAYTRLAITSPGPAERLDDDAEILAAISMNPNAIGIVNAASLPGPTSDLRPPTSDSPTSDIRNPISAIALLTPAGRPILPTSPAVFTGQYPLTEPLIAYIAPSAPPTASEVFLKSLHTPAAQAAMKAQGIMPIP